MTDTLLLIGAGLMGGGYVGAAHDLGLRTVLLDEDTWRGRHAHRVSRFITPEGTTETHWLEAALAAARVHRPHGALPFAEPHVLAAAWVQERHGLPGPSLAAADASRNKAVQRALFAHAGLPQPQWTAVEHADAAAEWSRGRYPVVVKPLRGMGSTGVRRVNGEDALRADLAGRDLAQQVLVEEYVDAPEFSWEGLVQDGRVLFGNYTRKTTTGPPEFVELQHQLPWWLDDAEQRERLDAATAALVSAAGIRSALVHLEFRDDGRTLLPMEFAVRTPGDHIMELMSRAWRHDFFASAVELAIGREVRLPREAPRAAGVVFVPAPRSGRLLAVDGTDAARARPEVVRVGQKKHAGDLVGGLRSSGDRVAHALLVAEDQAGVEAAADAVRGDITVRMADDPVAPGPLPAAVNGPVAVVCKWRPDMIRPLLELTANVHLVLDPEDDRKAEAERRQAEENGVPALVDQAASVYRVESVDSLEALTGVAVDLKVRRARVEHVLCFAEDGQLGAAQLRSLLGLAATPLEGAAVRDKRLMKRLVEAAGVPVAPWAPLPEHPGIAALPDVGYPAVVKPAFGFGTMATARVTDADDLTAHLAAARPDRLHSGHMMVERFVEGREFHVDALWSGGKPLYFAVSAYDAPRLETVPDRDGRRARDGSRILPREAHPDLYDRLQDMHIAVNDALGIGDAATHLEAFHTPDDRLVFSEVATRLGGGWIPAMLGAHVGGDVHRAVASGLLRGHADVREPLRRHVGGLHLRPERAGLIAGMPDDATIRAVPGVLDWRKYKQDGDRFGLDHAMDWCLVVVFGADTEADLEATAQRIERDLRIGTVPE